MKPIALDEFPVHQVPLPMARVGSSDRGFYDRCYLNALDPGGTAFLVTGLGTYPNLGVVDAYASVRIGDVQHTVRFSDALEERSLDQRVGGYRVEVVEPLSELRVVCEHELVSFDLSWRGSFPAVLEQPHVLLTGNRPTLDAQRFAQVGTWEGTLQVAGQEHAVSEWVGTRDRSWGIRPSGEPEPPGRAADEPMAGFWWLYAPLRFDDFAIVVIVQESPDGYRTLNDATRVYADGRVEQLGWPRVEIDYWPGTREPVAAALHLTTPAGEPLLVEIEPRSGIALHVGCGYGGDPTWGHGQWKGRDWSEAATYDLVSEEIRSRLPWGVTDHPARATCAGQVGWGLFEHASIGRHDPSGFADWGSVS